MDTHKFTSIYTWIMGFIIHAIATSILLEIPSTSAATWNNPNGEGPGHFGHKRRSHNKEGYGAEGGGRGGGGRERWRGHQHFLPFDTLLYSNNQSTDHVPSSSSSENLLGRGRGRKRWYRIGGVRGGGRGGGREERGGERREYGRRGYGGGEEREGDARGRAGDAGYARKQNYEDYEHTDEVGEGLGWYQGLRLEGEGDDPQVESYNRPPPPPSPPPPLPPPPDGPPHFDLTPNKNVTAMMGNAAYLHCIVHDLYNYTVSWIRDSDLHILTVAQYTYTADQRFECVHRRLTNEWILKVKYTQPRDTGRYECQVNTKPTIGFVVNLHVIVPSARVLGKPERYLDTGSTINLTCIITYSPEPPAYVFWYLNNKVLQYDESDSRVSIITDRGEVTRTYLLIHDAKSSDSGVYTCAPSTASPASVTIHVLNGESTAAMQMNGALQMAQPFVATFALVAVAALNAVVAGTW